MAARFFKHKNILSPRWSRIFYITDFALLIFFGASIFLMLQPLNIYYSFDSQTYLSFKLTISLPFLIIAYLVNCLYITPLLLKKGIWDGLISGVNVQNERHAEISEQAKALVAQNLPEHKFKREKNKLLKDAYHPIYDYIARFFLVYLPSVVVFLKHLPEHSDRFFNKVNSATETAVNVSTKAVKQAAKTVSDKLKKSSDDGEAAKEEVEDEPKPEAAKEEVKDEPKPEAKDEAAATEDKSASAAPAESKAEPAPAAPAEPKAEPAPAAPAEPKAEPAPAEPKAEPKPKATEPKPKATEPKPKAEAKPTETKAAAKPTEPKPKAAEPKPKAQAKPKKPDTEDKA